jgi:tetratricopeptide (TPR) repeat protein
MRGIFATVLAVAITGLAGAAAAQDVSEARRHYELGTRYYDLQRYADAAKEYEAAFVIKDDPALLFNIGQAYRLAQNPRKAIGAYRSYLRRVPNDPRRAEIERRIADLQTQIDREQKNAESPPLGTIQPNGEPAPKPAVEPTPPPAPTPQPAPAPAVQPAPEPSHAARTKKIAAYVLGGVGVAALAAGIGLEVAAKSANDKLTNPPAGTHFNPSQETTVKVDQSAGIAMLAVGGAAVATGVALFVWAHFEERRAKSVAIVPTLGAGHAGVAISGGF